MARYSPGEWDDAVFVEHYPPPPYSHLLTRPDEVKYSPYESLLVAMTNVPPPALGIYQAIFQPVRHDHDWHTNVEELLDLEFAIKLHSGLQLPQRHAQQAPSGDLRQMAGEAVTKAHSDKPFYALVMRVAVIGAGTYGKGLLRSLATFTSLFQHGGRPLNLLSEADYGERIREESRRRYCRPAEEVRKLIRRRYGRGFALSPSGIGGMESEGLVEELACDEF